jgi:hypothetical protein
VRLFGKAESADIANPGTSFADVISQTITAPQAGFVFIVATISAEDDSDFANGGYLEYLLALDGTRLTNQDGYHQLATSGVTVAGASGAVSAVVPVSAGSHTVSLQAKEIGTGSYVRGRDISVMFAPKGSGTTPPF